MVARKKDSYVGELDIYKVYRKSFGGIYYAINFETNAFVLSGDTYEELFDELAYIIAERDGKIISG